jgi:hypothetical protein
MKVTFNDVEEFLEELAKDAPPSRILRLTRNHRFAGSVPYASVSVVAGYVNARGELVELSIYVGDNWPGDSEYGRKTREYGDLIIQRIEAAARAAGIEVRTGRFAPDKESK